MGKIDFGRFALFIENRCSEGPLDVAFKRLAENSSNDVVYAGVGLLFTLLSLIGVILTLIFQTGLRRIVLPRYRLDDPMIYNLGNFGARATIPTSNEDKKQLTESYKPE